MTDHIYEMINTTNEERWQPVALFLTLGECTKLIKDSNRDGNPIDGNIIDDDVEEITIFRRPIGCGTGCGLTVCKTWREAEVIDGEFTGKWVQTKQEWRRVHGS